MNNIFLELTVLLITAGAISVIVSMLKQPSIIAYLLTGILIGTFGVNLMPHNDILQGLSQVGVTLLLFMIGLELDLGQLKALGRHAIVAGVVQVTVTMLLAFLLNLAFDFSLMASFLFALGITFSSTIIAVKLLAEKKELQSLYGKLTVGILLVQDFAAILVLMFLSGFQNHSSRPLVVTVLFTLLKVAVLAAIIFWHSKHVFPKILKFIGKSDELILIFSLAWALGLASLVHLPFLGLSIEIGGFLAGLALANSAVHYSVSARIKPLRDFFIIIFFIALGSQLKLTGISTFFWPGIIMFFFVICVKPFVVMTSLTLQGFKPRTAFMAAIMQTQISEFSLILMAMGLQLNLIGASSAGIFGILAICSIIASSYLMSHSATIFEKLKPFWLLFHSTHEAEAGLEPTILKNHIILVGAHRLGQNLIRTIQNSGQSFVIVDFNPDIAYKYSALGYHVICGDIADTHIQEIAGLDRAKMVISTVPNIHENLALIESIKKLNPRAKLIVTATEEEDALKLYKQNIDYVLLPHYIGGLHLARVLHENHTMAHFKKLRAAHLQILNKLS